MSSDDKAQVASTVSHMSYSISEFFDMLRNFTESGTGHARKARRLRAHDLMRGPSRVVIVGSHRETLTMVNTRWLKSGFNKLLVGDEEVTVLVTHMSVNRYKRLLRQNKSAARHYDRIQNTGS
jgi:hypothetical protein